MCQISSRRWCIWLCPCLWVSAQAINYARMDDAFATEGDNEQASSQASFARFAGRAPVRYTAPSAITLGAPNAHGVRAFVDSEGYERHFHGVNAVVKGPPWHPSVGEYDFETSLVNQDFLLLQGMGVTVIRLGMMWAGVEPLRGQYNYSYIETLRGIAKNAAAYGIYTLLDMHQDGMSERFCGEGLPAWAVQPSGQLPFPEPVGPAFRNTDPATGFPTRSECALHAWSSYYLSEACSTAYEALYSNADGLLDAWGAMWHTVAAAFKGDTHILGIEAINEPFAGDFLHHPSLLRPKLADSVNLQKVYDALAAQVWAADPTRLFFFQAVPWANVGSGFPHAPAGASNGYRSVLVYHHYEIPWGPQFQNSTAEHAEVYAADAMRLGTGLMLTEFAEQCGASFSGWDGVTRTADAYVVSWTSWMYKAFCKGGPYPTPESQWNEFGARKTGVGGCLFDSDGSVRRENEKAQARPYAQFVAGRLLKLEFDASSARLLVTIQPHSPPLNGTHTSLIYISQALWYPSGYQVTVQPPGAAVWGPMGHNYLAVRVLEERGGQGGGRGRRLWSRSL